jgi:hypothetical protein
VKLKALEHSTSDDEAVDGHLQDDDIVELKMPKLRKEKHEAGINIGEISEIEAGVVQRGREAERGQWQQNDGSCPWIVRYYRLFGAMDQNHLSKMGSNLGVS